jgi:predicted nucleic acid-binding protein
MILYLDSSALVKRFVVEAGSADVGQVVAAASVVGTAVISRAEVAAALARAVRTRTLQPGVASRSLQTFREHWANLVRLPLTEAVVARADALAWEQGLRGSEAVHLAAALTWQEALGQPLTLATFDRQLRAAAGRVGLAVYPDDLPATLGGR